MDALSLEMKEIMQKIDNATNEKQENKYWGAYEALEEDKKLLRREMNQCLDEEGEGYVAYLLKED